MDGNMKIGQKRKQRPVALPTRDEQKYLQQVGSLLRSNLLQFQINEILNQVSCSKVLNSKKVDAWITRVSEVLSNEQFFKSTDNATSFDDTISSICPDPDLRQSFLDRDTTNTDLTLKGPVRFEIIGSYVTQTGTSPYINIDMAVIVPTDTLDPRDILNNNYFRKRSIFLSTIAKRLSTLNDELKGPDSALFGRLGVQYFKGDLRKPLLILHPPFQKALCLRLIPVPGDGVFKLVQLRAIKNNVRPAYWTEKLRKNREEGIGAGKELDANSLPPTPLYNLSVLEDFALMQQHRILARALLPFPALRDALVLCKIWLTQRSLRFSSDGFDSHHCSLLIAYLVQTRRLSPGNPTSTNTIITNSSSSGSSGDSSSARGSAALTAFQTWLHFLAQHDLSRNVLDFSDVAVRPRDAPQPLSVDWDFGRPASLLHPLVEAGGAGTKTVSYNALWRVSASAAESLHREAQRSLQALQNRTDLSSTAGAGGTEKGPQPESDSSVGSSSDTSTCFEGLFLRKRGLFETHDAFFHLPLDPSRIKTLAAKSEAKAGGLVSATEDWSQERKWVLDEAPPFSGVLAAEALEVAKRAFGDRVLTVNSTIRCCRLHDSEEEGTAEDSGAAGLKGDWFSAHYPTVSLSFTSGVSSGEKGTTSGKKKKRKSISTSSSTTAGLKQEPEKFQWLLSVGVVLQSDNVGRRVDRAPVGTGKDPEKEKRRVGEFKDFWGGRCELRRFRDGAIVEAVVWGADRPQETGEKLGFHILEQILRFAWSKHLPALAGDLLAADKTSLRVVTNQLEHLLESVVGEVVGDATDNSRKAVESLDQLRAILCTRGIGLPLTIEGLDPLSAELRYTGLVPPAPHPVLEGVEGKALLRRLAGQTVSLLAPPLMVSARLEGSAKWPLKGEGVRQCKTALLLRLHELLDKKHQIRSVVHRDSLDVLFRGFVFRLLPVTTPDIEVFQLRDGSGLEVELTGAALLRRRELELLEISRRQTVPALYQQGVRSLRARFPSFGTAVRLLQLWVAKHHLTGHLSVEAMEALTAVAYRDPGSVPSTPLAGFYRSLLSLVEHDWAEEPLLVDFSTDLSSFPLETRLSITNRFRVIRASSTKRFIPSVLSYCPTVDDSPSGRELLDLNTLNPPMYIVTSADRAIDYLPSLSASSPEPVVLGMLLHAAKKSAEGLREWMAGLSSSVQDTEWEAESVLRHVMGSEAVPDNANVVIRFQPAVCCVAGVNQGPAFARVNVFANLPAQTLSFEKLLVRPSVFTAHPLQEEVVAKLRRTFHEVAVFFWDGTRGDSVSVLWRPQLFLQQSFAILNCRYAQCQEGEGGPKLTPNVEELISQMMDLGDGLLVEAEEK